MSSLLIQQPPLVHHRVVNRRALLWVVAAAIFLDYVLVTVIVPILPMFLENPKPHQSTNVSTTANVSLSPNISNTSTTHSSLANVTLSPFMTNATQFNHLQLTIGIILSSKTLVQMICNPFSAVLTARIGYSIPMFLGFVVLFLSTTFFAFAPTTLWLLFSRAFQGIGSSLTTTAGLGSLSEAYTDDKERGIALSRALAGLALGVLIGPLFGSVFYEIGGKPLPFIILAIAALLNGVVQAFVLRLRIERPTVSARALTRKQSGMFRLLLDPYIFICAVAITIGNTGISALETTLPLWMQKTFGASALETGGIFFISSLCYLFGTNILNKLTYKFGRWQSSCVALLCKAVAFAILPFLQGFFQLFPAMLVLGTALGISDSSLIPELARLGEQRHNVHHGTTMALADSAISLSFFATPIWSAALVASTSFEILCWIIGAMALLCAPLLILLQRSKRQISNAVPINETQPLIIDVYQSQLSR